MLRVARTKIIHWFNATWLGPSEALKRATLTMRCLDGEGAEVTASLEKAATGLSLPGEPGGCTTVEIVIAARAFSDESAIEGTIRSIVLS